MPLAPAIDDPSMLPTCENCRSDVIGMTLGTDVILCPACSAAAQEILAGWKGWPKKEPSPVVTRHPRGNPTTLHT